ncbi:PrsW family intramembrane metalloprotease [Hoyosella altamirensis]|uniref:RsiW-degrading membrane proteinase PrsW (M82 family) n=1 Tax=Hoyosella altamirensis TaxID=616997 RepID=A0A839RJN4_9ACTN|nr:PrsW family intramembrane metalloprotease [Hoyosella altamirensis]MBB3036509.1 RsiW-degrading membrane proteinase PrsW (M82 family) [Hoyosella altamirensis]
MQSPHHVQWSVEHNRRALVPIAVIVIMAVVAVGLVAVFSLSTGIAIGLVATLLAFAPVIPIAMLFLWIDRWEPEPGRLLLAAFLWGASIAVVTALIGSLVLNITWLRLLATENTHALGLAVTAPVVEELCKGLFLLWLFWFRRREIDGVVDGIVYAGLVGLGFAFMENIFYLGAALEEGGLAGGLFVFVLRCLISPFAHPLFTIMFGVGLGLAVQSSRPLVKALAPACGLLLAIAMHGLWNGSILVLDGAGFLLVYALIMVPVFIGAIVIVTWQRKRLQRVVAQQLPRMVSTGLIHPGEVAPLACLTSRGRWRTTVQQRQGADAAKGVKDYHAVITELAILYDRQARGAIGDDYAKLERELVAGLYDARARAHSYPAALTTASQAVGQRNPYLRA